MSPPDQERPRRTLPDLLLAYEKIVIAEALARCDGSRTRAAAVLGITRTHFYRRVRAAGIDLGAVKVRVGRPPSGGTVRG